MPTSKTTLAVALLALAQNTLAQNEATSMQELIEQTMEELDETTMEETTVVEPAVAENESCQALLNDAEQRATDTQNSDAAKWHSMLIEELHARETRYGFLLTTENPVFVTWTAITEHTKLQLGDALSLEDTMDILHGDVPTEDSEDLEEQCPQEIAEQIQSHRQVENRVKEQRAQLSLLREVAAWMDQSYGPTLKLYTTVDCSDQGVETSFDFEAFNYAGQVELASFFEQPALWDAHFDGVKAIRMHESITVLDLYDEEDFSGNNLNLEFDHRFDAAEMWCFELGSFGWNDKIKSFIIQNGN